uniref:UPF0235 protein n=1 Tax=Ascaris lumbricoides TaxID=6252 RepID=A0A0M3HWS0_ASCLU
MYRAVPRLQSASNIGSSQRWTPLLQSVFGLISGWRSKETWSLEIREWHSSCIRALDFRHRLMGRREVISDTTANKKEEDAAISVDKNGRILLKIHAKPNAKISRVTEINETEIEVAIAAPPHKGQANEALTDAIAEILGLRKNDVFFDTGARSRSKLLVINSQRITVEEVREKLKKSADGN